jgi:hypothetical protein
VNCRGEASQENMSSANQLVPGGTGLAGQWVTGDASPLPVQERV